MAKRTDLLIGIRAIVEGIRSGKEIDKILLRTGLRGELIGELMQEAKAHQVPVQYVPMEKINRLHSGNHQGVIAFISRIEYSKIESILPGIFEKGEDPFLLILDQITDVRNLGAIARSAECAGVHAIIVPEKGSAMINADAVKTSAGALNIIPVVRTSNLRQTIDFLRNSGLTLIAATEKAAAHHYSVNMSTPLAIILGNEETGISTEIIRTADHLVKIPLMGKIESLNVSAAASVILFEVVKQRLSLQSS
jgi:23S rRNA (guanosine2251-2'-O)-methyltransferase